jgi:hypothetical protein
MPSDEQLLNMMPEERVRLTAKLTPEQACEIYLRLRALQLDDPEDPRVQRFKGLEFDEGVQRPLTKLEQMQLESDIPPGYMLDEETGELVPEKSAGVRRPPSVGGDRLRRIAADVRRQPSLEEQAATYDPNDFYEALSGQRTATHRRVTAPEPDMSDLLAIWERVHRSHPTTSMQRIDGGLQLLGPHATVSMRIVAYSQRVMINGSLDGFSIHFTDSSFASLEKAHVFANTVIYLGTVPEPLENVTSLSWSVDDQRLTMHYTNGDVYTVAGISHD